MKLSFTKMHGCGNDYIYFDCFKQQIAQPEQLSIQLSDRHFGIGGDGIVLICPSEIADAQMRMFNADGSEGRMCGNAIRCVAKYLYDNRIVSSERMRIETRSGIKEIEVYPQDGLVQQARVNMGMPAFAPEDIPVVFKGAHIINEPLVVGGKVYRITCVSMGNPHCVVFCPDVDEIALDQVGPLFEKHPIFPENVNTEFITVIDHHTLKMRVWERGSGETWACGTGACGAVAAAIANGYCSPDEDIIVKLKGGDLVIRSTDEGIFMTGGAVCVFSGEIEI